jgi:hypothetical protein
MSYSPDQPQAPIEDVNRGTVVALLTIPAGVIVWTLVWSIGVVASIVTFGVAILATFLYRLGSGGVIGRAGAIRITAITLVTVVLSIIAGLVADVAIGIGQVAGISPIEALTHPGFGDVFGLYLSSGDGGLYLSLGIAVLFGILGCFSVLRGAFAATAAVEPQAQTPWPTLPANPQADPFADEKPIDPTSPR